MKYGIHITIALSLIIICPSFLHSGCSQKEEEAVSSCSQKYETQKYENSLSRVEGKAKRFKMDKNKLVAKVHQLVSDNNMSKEEALEYIEFNLDQVLHQEFKKKKHLVLMRHHLVSCLGRLGFIPNN